MCEFAADSEKKDVIRIGRKERLGAIFIIFPVIDSINFCSHFGICKGKQFSLLTPAACRASEISLLQPSSTSEVTEPA